VKNLAFTCLGKGQSTKTVQNLIRALSSLIGHAVEDRLLTVNLALKPGKFLPAFSKSKATNPYNHEEVATLLEVCKECFPRLFPLLLCAVRSGLRQGELLALQWPAITDSELAHL
jgi:integrase